MLTDEQIFDILDGIASDEIQHQHNYLLNNSQEYQAYFQEMDALHLDLCQMPIEKPSTQFTENILANLAIESQSIKRKSWSNKLIYAFLVGIISILAAVVAFVVSYLPPSKTIINAPISQWMEISNTFMTDTMVKILVLANLIVLLVIFDKKVLKPYFINRNITLG